MSNRTKYSKMPAVLIIDGEHVVIAPVKKLGRYRRLLSPKAKKLEDEISKKVREAVRKIP